MTTSISLLAIVPCLLANAFAEPVKEAVAAAFVPEGASPVVPDGEAPSVPPDGGLADGETLLGAFLARSVKLSMVRDLFCAGLFQII